MKTTKPLLIICVCLGVVVAAMAVTVAAIFQDSRDLRRDVRIARAESDTAVGQVKQLEAEKADLAEQLAIQRDEAQKAETDLADAKDKDADADANASSTSPVKPRPTRVRTYLGNQYLGTSWLIPSAAKDAKTGAVTYEPVLLLDEAMKQNLVTYKTNIVEREVARSSTVNYNYPWVYYYPVVVRAHTNRSHDRDADQTPETPPPGAAQPPNPGPSFNTRNMTPVLLKPNLPIINPAPVPPKRVPMATGFQSQSVGVNDQKSLAVWTPAGR